MDGWMGKWDETHKKASQNQLSTPDKKEPPTKKDAAAETDPADSAVLLPGEGDGTTTALEPKGSKFVDFESQFSVAHASAAPVQVQPREKWGSECEFLMSCIASAVGLGNIWRFPVIAGANGGGAFLIPYLVVLTIVGRPLYLMELGLGQFSSSGPIKVWELLPAFRGIGYGATLASFFVATFYVCIMGWAIVYFGYSCFPVFPWTDDTPGPFFQSKHLRDPGGESQFRNGTGLDGAPVLNVAMGLLASWVLVWAVMIGGVSGSGKISYFTALFPYVVLLILLIAGCTLDGAGDGILYFIKPDFKKLLMAKTWFQAISQCFFSLGISFGGCYMFASYNEFHHNLGRDILIISIMDTFTSMLAGTCLFSLIGSLAVTKHSDMLHEYKAKVALGETPKVEITNEVSSVIASLASEPGAGMAFVTFPEVLHAFPKGLDNFISALFFFMIVVLAVGSANGLMGTVIAEICDHFPKWNRRIVVTVLCIVSFFIGLIYTLPSGSQVIDIVDKHGSEIVIYVLATCEVIGVAWIYGTQNLCNDFEFMLGVPVSPYWIVCWAILPLIMIGIFLSYIITYVRPEGWPDSALGCAWSLSIFVWLILPITFFGVWHTRKSKSTKKRCRISFQFSKRWGPRDPALRESWRRFKRTRPDELRLTMWFRKACKCSKSIWVHEDGDEEAVEEIVTEVWNETVGKQSDIKRYLAEAKGIKISNSKTNQAPEIILTNPSTDAVTVESPPT